MADLENYVQALPGHSVVGMNRYTGKTFTLPVIMWAVTVFDPITSGVNGVSHDAVVVYEGGLALSRGDLGAMVDELTILGVYADTDVPEALNDLSPIPPDEAVAEALDPWAEKYNRPGTGQNR